jgi:predicted metal-dependent HD superfamily phosphohydrolase
MRAQQQFAALWRKIEAPGDSVPVFELLRSHYTDKRRAYHNLKHIQSCLDELKDVRGRCVSAVAVEFALWFHDIVYDSHAKDNEEQSAALSLRVAKDLKLSKKFCRHVEELILATKHAAIPDGADAQIIVDIDLSILGQSDAVFDKYERKIRREYAWVPESQFRSGRAAILKGFLARPRIFSTEHFRKKYEKKARANMARSLAKLARSK